MNKDGILLEVHGMCKSFGPTRALAGVSMFVRKGEIHGLIGENGSGKSTLSSIIAGVQRFDAGEMRLEGAPYQPKSVLEANERHVCMVVQEQGTFESVTVAANLFVGKEHLFANRIGILSTKKMIAEGRRVLDRIGATHIRADAMTATLSFEDRKLVEIARAMQSEPKLMIIDESTTALSKSGRDILYGLMRANRAAGCSMLFISHDIDEIMEMCDSLTVLRDGNFVGRLDKAEFNDHAIKGLMVGRDIGDAYYREDTAASRRPERAMSVNNLSHGMLRNVTLDLHRGEIVGVGGLTDCGMHDLGKAMFGLLKPDSGEVVHSDGVRIDSPRRAMRQKIAYISKDRDREALMTGASIRDNICLPNLPKLERFGIITSKAERAFVDKWAKALSIKMNHMDQYVMVLSGGNKQKVSVSKWLGFEADIFLFDCPTRGIDIGVKQSIYRLMMELKAQGKAILMISEELPELIGMSDRVLIMKDGRIGGEFSRDEQLTEHRLIQYMI